MNNVSQSHFDAVIIGAGFGGMYAIFKLRATGMSVRAFEAGTDVGGTWYWNRYPGARCDVESIEYSYSFSEELQQEWSWSERYASQPEILRYAGHVADRFGLREDIRFNQRVLTAEFDPAVNLWTVRTDKGEVATAQFLITAAGCLSVPRMPDIPGRDDFGGNLYHTGAWPHEGVDFTGRRVGVIGTGSSGIQVIPQIAKAAAHCTVFQRTPNFSLAAYNKPMDPDLAREYKQNYATHRAKARHAAAGIASHPTPEKGAFDDSPSEREKLYEIGWNWGNTGFTRIYKDILSNLEANDTMADFVRRKIRDMVKNPDVAAMLTPNDHPIGTKRICLDTDYFETYNRDNVSLVDVRKHPITSISREGIHTDNEAYPLDAIVFATGYDAVTGAILGIDIRVKGRQESLAEKWSAGPRTYLGLMTAGFPNLFFITGPGSPSVLTNMISSIEQHVEWIAECLQYLRSSSVHRMEAQLNSEDAWVTHVNEVADTTLFPRAASWYIGANIPGKPRVFLPYVGGLGRYRARCDEVARRGYEGFSLDETAA
ncbi:phenylacetone monooxygenase [Paraburkholderia xenovorans LB400]|uniref:Cyclohexanone monooxygenase n=1 Tax=Paraburkholderia xenovorans (strain LB400) TaxID=266265 RepID=Q143T8_PARXL|nr:NAD(P)/FAD-dependent oxidoreductase [Paraburkholderia xenovorans]ABE29401.1 Cyclohexanone monooxygenase [Paraburkholderia xenovorans LB400]AIP30359.1 phenylacetone monooxygenase [Paraburkholderia xenovorans LB400]